MVRRGTGSCWRGTVPIGVHAAGDAGGASCLRRGSALSDSCGRGAGAAWRSLLQGLEVGVVGVAGGGDLSTLCAVRRRSTNARRGPAAGSGGKQTYPRRGAFCRCRRGVVLIGVRAAAGRIRAGGAAVGFRSGCAGGVACVRTRKHAKAPLAGGKPMTIRAGGSAGGFRSGCCIAGAGGVVCFGTRLAVAADLEQ